MGKTITINQDSLLLLKENLNEFMVDKNSNFVSHDSVFFILYRGDLMFFDEKNQKLLDDFFNRHWDDLEDFAYEYDQRKLTISSFNFDNFIDFIGSRVPYLITGYISNNRDVYVNSNENYDVLNSNELYQLVKKLPNCNFYLGYRVINKDEILGNKGQSKPKVWYHGTILKHALGILKGGMRPMPNDSLYRIKHDKTVFISSDFNQAKWYANFSSAKRRIFEKWAIKPCVLKIDASKIDESKIVYDYDVYNMHKIDKNDTEYNDRMKDLNLSYMNSTYTIDNQDPTKYKKVGYRGIIMPNAVISVYLVDYTDKTTEIPRDEFIEYAMKLKENVNEEISETAPEVDEYEIGAESDNPPMGGNSYHITESYGVSVNGDTDRIDYIDYVPHDNPREEGIGADEITDFVPYYELVCYDVNGKVVLEGELELNELFDYFPDSIVHAITNRQGRKVSQSEWRIDDILSWNTKPNNIDDVEEVNSIAKRIQTGGPSSYILTDGDVVSFQDHIYITSINGMTPSKFVALGNIRIGSGGAVEVSKEPTDAQITVLKNFIRRQDKVYLDIVEDSGRMYPNALCSAAYEIPNPNRIVNDIIYYFREGVKPQGNYGFYESKKSQIAENSYDAQSVDVISLAKEEFGITSRLNQAGYILPDGSLLNFGSDGYRETDHRQIAIIYKENNIKIWSDEYRYNYVVDFMNHGAIRCDVNAGILDMTQEPTREQYYVIKNFVRRAEDVDIDFTDKRGNTEHSVSYSDAKPQMVVADIQRYYNEGIKPQGNVQYESKSMKNILENFDFEVNSSEIDLSSFKKKHELVPSIWKPNGKLNSKIRLKLLDIADDFWEFVNLTWVKPSGIILTGSICNFNWSQYSDIDLHLIVDFDEIDEKTEFVKDYLDSKKNEWNNEHNTLEIMGYRVELYVQNLGEMPQSSGIYDLEENDWIKEPNPNDIKPIGLNKFPIKDKVAKIMTIIDDMYDALASTDDSYEIEQIGDDASYLWKKVKDMRKSSLEKDGESSSGNICYKYLRRVGYLDKLWRLRTMTYDKINSINESIKKYLTLLKEELINEEWVADGNAEHNPYKKRWDVERKALKDFVTNYGKLMQSKENGKLYKCYYDKTLSQLIGYNYCICIQWDSVKMKPKSVLYIRALDKFTPNIKQVNFDDRGRDNTRGTIDDYRGVNTQYQYQ